MYGAFWVWELVGGAICEGGGTIEDGPLLKGEAFVEGAFGPDSECMGAGTGSD